MKLVTEAQDRHCEGESFSAAMGTPRRFGACVFSSVCAHVTSKEENDGHARIQRKIHCGPRRGQLRQQAAHPGVARVGSATTPGWWGPHLPARDGSSSRSDVGQRAGWSKSGGREEHCP